MFIIKTDTSNETIKWPVKVEVASDGGKISKFEFTGTFKRLNDEQKEALAEEVKEDDTEGVTEGDNAWKVRAVDNILKTMVDWKGVADEERKPIELTRDNLLAAARSHHGISIIRAIHTAISEINVGARAKN